MAYAGVPDQLAKRFRAGDWVKAPLTVLGGKGGGKPTSAQGQGPNVAKLAEAMEAASQYAKANL